MNEHGTGEQILNDADFDYVINILEGAGESDWESVNPSQQSIEGQEWRPHYTVEKAKEVSAKRNGIFVGILAYENAQAFMRFMNEFKSEKAYVKRLHDLDMHKFSLETLPRLTSLACIMEEYILDKYAETAPQQQKNAKDCKRYSPSALRSMYSIFKKFHKYAGYDDLAVKAPLIEDKLKQWDAKYEATKAGVFTLVNIFVMIEINIIIIIMLYIFRKKLQDSTRKQTRMIQNIWPC